jgi:hypothetical protein
MATHPVVRPIVLAVICLLAAKLTSSAQVVNGSFEDTTSPYFTNGQNPYSDQYPAYNDFPTVVMFNGWESASRQGGLRYQEISTAGYTGADGSYAVQGLDGGAAIESLNPVTQIAANTTYTLTLSLNVPAGTSGASFQLLATSQGPNPNTGYTYNPGPGYVPILSPNPLIMTLGVLADSSVIPAGSTGATDFADYTINFNTLDGANASFLGDNLSILINLDPNGGTGDSVDNVRLTETTVPEPSTYALIGLGLLSLVALGKFRKLSVNRDFTLE